MSSTAEFLASVPLFRDLDAEETGRFAQLVREKGYPRTTLVTPSSWCARGG